MTTATKKEKAPVKPKFIRFRTVEGTVGGFVSDAFSEITSLGEEFREICDNTPDSLQNSDPYSRRDDTAGQCEGLSEPDVSNDILSEISASYSADYGKLYRGRISQSRACRASNAASAFSAAADAVRQWVEDHPAVDEDSTKAEKKEHEKMLEEKGWSADDFAEAHDQADTLISECEDIEGEIVNMEWPGMFG